MVFWLNSHIFYFLIFSFQHQDLQNIPRQVLFFNDIFDTPLILIIQKLKPSSVERSIFTTFWHGFLLHTVHSLYWARNHLCQFFVIIWKFKMFLIVKEKCFWYFLFFLLRNKTLPWLQVVFCGIIIGGQVHL